MGWIVSRAGIRYLVRSITDVGITSVNFACTTKGSLKLSLQVLLSRTQKDLLFTTILHITV